MELPQPSSRRLAASVVLFILPAALAVVFFPPAAAAATTLTLSPSPLNFGQLTVGQSETLVVTVTNASPASVTIASVSSSNGKFAVSGLILPKTLASGASLKMNVIFAPTSPGAQAGIITFQDGGSFGAGASLGVEGSGVTAPAITANPSSLSFGSVAVGTSSTLSFALTNTGTSGVTITGLQVTGSPFSVSGPKFPVTLAAGKVLNLNAIFKPQSAGASGGSVLLSTGLTVPLSGIGFTGKSVLTTAPATLSFGNVAVGTTETLTVGLNAAGASVSVSSISSSSAQFAVQGVSFPLTVPVGQEVSLNVTFTPKNNSAATGALVFTSNASDSPTSESLSGTGTTPYVTLYWNASTSSSLKGYNVYRSTSKSGSPTRLNSSVDPQTSYTDTTVAAGNTYYYVTTAVNSSGQESAPSAQVEVQVP